MNLKQKSMYVIGGGFLALGLFAGCSNEEAAPSEDKAVETEEKTEEIKEQVAVPETEQKAENEKPKDNIINISAYEMGYTPPSVTLEKGKEYTLVLKNDGKVFHDLTAKKFDVEITYMGDMPDHPKSTGLLDDLLGVNKAHASGDHGGGHEETKYIHMNANPGQTVKIKFIPEESGEFKFYCSVPGHEEAGMHGSVKVD